MKNLNTAFFGGGCFWCAEAIFRRVRGVMVVTPGYMGGNIPSPSYELVCTGRSGHAETVRVDFDPSIVSFAELLAIFFATHDPTTLNRQGADSGTQYRSVIFYTNEEQRQQASEAIRRLDEAHEWPNPVVTSLEIVKEFYPAEAYHHDYFEKNPNQGYCIFVIAPKLEKFEKLFKDKLHK